MKTGVILFNTSCIFEVVILNYFLKYNDKEVVFISIDGEPIVATEGYSINVDKSIIEAEAKDFELIVVPGGDISDVDNSEVYEFLNDAYNNKSVIAGICAGVDLLEKSGILSNVNSIHNKDTDVVVDGNIITSRANAYVDFAIEVGKIMNLFKDEADLNETIEFWKDCKGL